MSTNVPGFLALNLHSIDGMLAIGIYIFIATAEPIPNKCYQAVANTRSNTIEQLLKSRDQTEIEALIERIQFQSLSASDTETFWKWFQAQKFEPRMVSNLILKLSPPLPAVAVQALEHSLLVYRTARALSPLHYLANDLSTLLDDNTQAFKNHGPVWIDWVRTPRGVKRFKEDASNLSTPFDVEFVAIEEERASRESVRKNFDLEEPANPKIGVQAFELLMKRQSSTYSWVIPKLNRQIFNGQIQRGLEGLEQKIKASESQNVVIFRLDRIKGFDRASYELVATMNAWAKKLFERAPHLRQLRIEWTKPSVIQMQELIGSGLDI